MPIARTLVAASIILTLCAPPVLDAKEPTADELGKQTPPGDPNKVIDGLKTFEDAIKKADQDAKTSAPDKAVKDAEDKYYKESVKLDEMEKSRANPRRSSKPEKMHNRRK